jgi:hypothetical protein
MVVNDEDVKLVWVVLGLVRSIRLKTAENKGFVAWKIGENYHKERIMFLSLGENKSSLVEVCTLAPKMDSPPVPSLRVKSPPWAMKFGMMRWNRLFLKASWAPDDADTPRSPVHRQRKFSAVRGVKSWQTKVTKSRVGGGA